MSAFSDAVDQGDLEDNVRGVQQRTLRSVKMTANYILSFTLVEVLELQTILAQSGVVLEFHTAEIISIEQPSLGKET